MAAVAVKGVGELVTVEGACEVQNVVPISVLVRANCTWIVVVQPRQTFVKFDTVESCTSDKSKL